MELKPNIIQHIQAEIKNLMEGEYKGEIIIELNKHRDSVLVQTIDNDKSDINKIIEDVKNISKTIDFGRIIITTNDEDKSIKIKKHVNRKFEKCSHNKDEK